MGRTDHKDSKETLSSLHRKKMQEIEDDESNIADLQERITELQGQISLVGADSVEGREKALEVHALQNEMARIGSQRINYLLRKIGRAHV